MEPSPTSWAISWARPAPCWTARGIRLPRRAITLLVRRVSTGSMPTDHLFTGQRAMLDLGIYHFGARFYDPTLGRFLSADTVLPGAGNSQAYDRYAFVLNNPLIHSDPSGHNPFMFGGSGGKAPTLIEKVQYIYSHRPSDAGFVADLYRTNLLPGNTPQERTKTIMELSWSGPYQQFNGEYEHEGFKHELQDNGDQVGHFLTAVRFGNASRPYTFLRNYVLMSIALGHETIGDETTDNRYVTSALQIFYGLNPVVHALFNIETDDAYKAILNSVPVLLEVISSQSTIVMDRTGNSLADLRLTKIGWNFGSQIRDNEFATNVDVAQWLTTQLCQNPSCSP
jgi:RHS repeat-associated protein